jgi:hypothetical protein
MLLLLLLLLAVMLLPMLPRAGSRWACWVGRAG